MCFPERRLSCGPRRRTSRFAGGFLLLVFSLLFVCATPQVQAQTQGTRPKPANPALDAVRADMPASAGKRGTCGFSAIREQLPRLLKEGAAEARKARFSIRPNIGGRNFTDADLDTAEVPFYCSINGLGDTPVLHDGGEWPNTGGNTALDDGRPASGTDWAGEFYDLDGNGHYPKAVLRYIGTHCYIFVPPMFFPTLPKKISPVEEVTPPASETWGMYWPDTERWSSGKYYFAAGTGTKTLEPRFCLGQDKALARLKLQELAEEFDQRIYPKLKEYIGNEPNVDGDPKIFILLDDIRDGEGTTCGYVSVINQLPYAINAKSNEKELINLDLFPTFLLGAKSGYETTAHEFAHLIHLNEGGSISGSDIMMEEAWVDEGVAEYAIYAYDGVHTSNVDNFITTPDIQLTRWLGEFANYGASYLFLFYLVDHYGKPSIQAFLKNLVRDKAQGIDGMNNALKPFGTDYLRVFLDWVIANSLDKTKDSAGNPLNDGKWGYSVDNDADPSNDLGRKEKLPVYFSDIMNAGSSSTTSLGRVNLWAADCVRISGGKGNVNIGFDGDDQSRFRCAVLKRGPDVDPSVEYIHLNDRQAGNLIIQDYGLNSTWDRFYLIPSAIQETVDSPVIDGSVPPTRKYTFSVSFNDLKIGVIPNPAFENDLHVVVRTKDPYAALPLVQVIWQLKPSVYVQMSTLSPTTAIGNHRLTESGDGTIEASCMTANGLSLFNRLAFSARYYDPKDTGQFTSIHGNLVIPRGALRTGGLIFMAPSQEAIASGGLEFLSDPVSVSIPTAEPPIPVAVALPLKTAQILDETRIGLFEATSRGTRFLAPAERQGTVAVASLSRSGTLFIARDAVAPSFGNEFETLPSGELVLSLRDTGSGIEPSSLSITRDGQTVFARYDESRGRIVIPTTGLTTGRNIFAVSVADRLGNQTSMNLTANLTGTPTVGACSVYPSPARTSARFRATLGGAAAVQEAEAVIRDVSGARVTTVELSHIGNGVFEATWNLRNDDGREAANGAYFVEFRAMVDGRRLRRRTPFAILR